METKRSIKAVAAVFLGVSLMGLLLSVGATSATEAAADPATVVVFP